MSVKKLTILIIPLILLASCGRKVAVREYVEVVQLPQRPEPQMASTQMPSTAKDPMRAGPLSVAPIPENLPSNHPTMPAMHPPVAGGSGANVMSGRESEVPPAPVVTDLSWDLPTGWQVQGGSGMRIAEFYPEPANPEVLVTLIALSGAAGSLEGNVVRWRGQIALSPNGESNIQHRDGKFHYELLSLVEESKTLQKPQTIVAAIYQQPNRTLFLKFMGPTEMVAAHQAEFLQLADSLSEKDGAE